MRKFFAAAAGLSAAAILTSSPASADITLGVCFRILDQLKIVEEENFCVASVEGHLADSGQGPYYVDLNASGNLLCTALEGKFLTKYAFIYGKITFDPLCLPALGCEQEFTLNEIGPDEGMCDF